MRVQKLQQFLKHVKESRWGPDCIGKSAFELALTFTLDWFCLMNLCFCHGSHPNHVSHNVTAECVNGADSLAWKSLLTSCHPSPATQPWHWPSRQLSWGGMGPWWGAFSKAPRNYWPDCGSRRQIVIDGGTWNLSCFLPWYGTKKIWNNGFGTRVFGGASGTMSWRCYTQTSDLASTGSSTAGHWS